MSLELTCKNHLSMIITVCIHEYVCYVTVMYFTGTCTCTKHRTFAYVCGRRLKLRTERDPGHIRLNDLMLPNPGIPNSMAGKGPTCKVPQIPREASKPVLKLHQYE